MIITVDPDRGFHERVLGAVAGTAWAHRSAHAEDPARADELVRTSRAPAVVVVGPRVSVPAATALTQRIVGGTVPVAVLLVTDPTNEVLRSAMRAGARDVLPPGFTDDELLAAIDRTQLAEAAKGTGPGVTVAVFSTKGGVGTSTVAANLAARMGDRLDAEAVLLDLDVASADQSIMHGLAPAWTLQELVDGTVGTDAESLRQVLLPVDGSSASVLPGPLDPALAETISGDAIGRVIAAARTVAPIVVLDTASAFDDRTLAAIDAADVIVVVSSLDVAALRALTVTLQTFERIGTDPSKVRVALVRADSRSGLQVTDVERAIGRTVDGRIPSSRAVVQSVNSGVPLAVASPRSSYVQAIDELIDSILEIASADLRDASNESSSRGWFSFGRSRSDSSDTRGGTTAPPAAAPVPTAPQPSTRPTPTDHAAPNAANGSPPATASSVPAPPGAGRERDNGVPAGQPHGAVTRASGPTAAASVAVVEDVELEDEDEDEAAEPATPAEAPAAADEPVADGEHAVAVDEVEERAAVSAGRDHGVSLDALPPPRSAGNEDDGRSRRFGRRR